MNVMPLLLFVSLVLALSAILFFVWNQLRGNSEHTDRLAILPFLDELTEKTSTQTKASTSTKEQADEND